MATAAKSYIAERGQTACIKDTKMWIRQANDPDDSSLRRDPELGCVLYMGKTSADGHWQVQRKPRIQTRDGSARAGANQHRAYYTHRIAYVALHGEDPVNPVSHLCGRGNCINSFHLHDELISLNVARINCLGSVVCPLHHHLLATLCPHNPPCIKKPVLAERCCLASLEEQSILESAPPSSSAPPSLSAAPVAPVAPLEAFFFGQHASSDWPASEDNFDVNDEIASSGATPPPTSTPPRISVPVARSSVSPPAWASGDDRESQDEMMTSDFEPEE